MSYKNICIIFSFLILCSGCFNSWSEQEIKVFELECCQTKEFKINPISFTGFDFSKDSSIFILEKTDSEVLDSFVVFPKTNPRGDVYWAHIKRKLNIDYQYEFIIDNNDTYLLDNMEMIVKSQFTMISEDYGCMMGNFTINEDTFKNVGNVWIKKRKSVYQWDN